MQHSILQQNIENSMNIQQKENGLKKTNMSLTMCELLCSRSKEEVTVKSANF